MKFVALSLMTVALFLTACSSPLSPTTEGAVENRAASPGIDLVAQNLKVTNVINFPDKTCVIFWEFDVSNIGQTMVAPNLSIDIQLSVTSGMYGGWKLDPSSFNSTDIDGFTINGSNRALTTHKTGYSFSKNLLNQSMSSLMVVVNTKNVVPESNLNNNRANTSLQGINPRTYFLPAVPGQTVTSPQNPEEDLVIQNFKVTTFIQFPDGRTAVFWECDVSNVGARNVPGNVQIDLSPVLWSSSTERHDIAPTYFSSTEIDGFTINGSTRALTTHKTGYFLTSYRVDGNSVISMNVNARYRVHEGYYGNNMAASWATAWLNP